MILGMMHLMQITYTHPITANITTGHFDALTIEERSQCILRQYASYAQSLAPALSSQLVSEWPHLRLFIVTDEQTSVKFHSLTYYYKTCRLDLRDDIDETAPAVVHVIRS